MAISFPRTDIMSLCYYSAQSEPWELQLRQEYSRTAGGVTIGKDFGTGLWKGGFTTSPLFIDDMVDFEAALNSLDGVINTFEAYDLRRPYPKANPTGAFSDTGTIYAVSGAKALRLTGLDTAQVISRGDYLSFDYGGNRYLHQAMETVTAISGVTPFFEVRPYLKTGLVLSPAIAVKLKKPSAVCTLVAGSIQKRMTDGMYGSVTFQASQVIL